MRPLTSSIVILSILISGLAAQAQEANLAKELDLSREQIQQIQAQRKEQVRTQAQTRAQIKDMERSLKKEMAKDEPDQEQVRAYVEQINRLRSSAFEQKVNAAVAAKKVLTREQNEKMRALRQQGESGQSLQYRHQERTTKGSGQDNRKGQGR